MSLLRHQQLLMSTSQSPSASWNSTVANLPGLWAWYQLDELAGAGTAADSSGNGRDGAYTGTGVRTTPGIFAGSAAYRSSLRGRVNLPPFPISSSPQFSIVAWIIPNRTGVMQSIVSGDIFGARIFQFRLDGSNVLQYITFTGPSAAHTMSGPSSVPDQEPAMVAATYDHGGAVRKALYINGAQVATTLDGTLFPTSTEAPLAIGARNNATTVQQELWLGGMDEVVITTTALSAGQILTLWNARNG